jgi:hypothetical protein
MSSDSPRSRLSSSKSTRIVLTWLVGFLSLSVGLGSCAAFGLGGPKPPRQPPRELCILGDSGCICFDPRLPEGKQSYVLTYAECRNYVATNPADYDAGQEWISRQCFGPKK